MSIDKKSNGVPEVNLSRRTTKVNLGMIIAVVLFFVLAAAGAYWASRHF
ncbi:MAG: hypothetical protein JSS11_10865 [Verrucomicrobia bacterium]|nr:hypothetical protein [Verrucomicrobiota bacterium]